MSNVHESTAPASERRKTPESGRYGIVATAEGVYTIETAGSMISVKRLIWCGELKDIPLDLPIEILRLLTKSVVS